MSTANIENYLPRRLNDQQSFFERAAACMTLLMTHSELIQTPNGVFNNLTVASSIEEVEDETPERTILVSGCCFEFLGPLFEVFLKSVTPADDDPAVSPEDTQVHLDFFARTIAQMEAKSRPDRFIQYKFEISDHRARVELETNGVNLKIANLIWTPHQ